jgi:hypothetical protein
MATCPARCASPSPPTAARTWTATSAPATAS